MAPTTRPLDTIDPPDITVVIPVLNEERNLEPLTTRLLPMLDGLGVSWKVLFVDDGSTDGTLAGLKAINVRDPRVTAVSLSRNFGKEIAIAAGLRHASGRAVIIMDADLQHPPEILAEFIRLWRQGYQVVYGQRRDRQTDSFLHRNFARAFYKLFNALVRTDIPEGAGDFRLLDRAAVDAMNQLGEASRFNKGLFSWIGFKSIGVPYDVADRHFGTTKWNFRKLARFALDGLTSFSTLPLRVWSLLGLAISLVAFGSALYFVISTLVFGADVPGFPSLIVSMMLLAGVQLISLGVIGEYLGRVYEEVKRRPLFIVADKVGLADAAPKPAAAFEPERTGAGLVH
jgi:glycosyltransferase involved in cell wall biosynthesis